MGEQLNVDGIPDAQRGGGPSVAKSLGRDAAKGCSDAAISASYWLSSNAGIRPVIGVSRIPHANLEQKS